MARFKGWKKPAVSCKRIELGGGVSLTFWLEGNWMELPKESRDWMGKLVDFIAAPVAEAGQKEGE